MATNVIEPPVEGQGVKTPEAESSVAFEALVEEPNLTLVTDSFLQFKDVNDKASVVIITVVSVIDVADIFDGRIGRGCCDCSLDVISMQLLDAADLNLGVSCSSSSSYYIT